MLHTNCKKLLLSFIVSICACSLVFTAPVYASGSIATSEGIPASVGYLIGPDGARKQVSGARLSPIKMNAKTGELSATYLFSVRAQDYSQWTNGADATGGVTAYLTIYWTSPDHPNESILLTRVSGGWSISDHQIAVRDSLVRYGCSSLLVIDQAVEIRSVPNPFNYKTGFDAPVAKGDNTTGVNLTLTLGEAGNPSSDTWTFFLVNNYND